MFLLELSYQFRLNLRHLPFQDMHCTFIPATPIYFSPSLSISLNDSWPQLLFLFCRCANFWLGDAITHTFVLTLTHGSITDFHSLSLSLCLIYGPQPAWQTHGASTDLKCDIHHTRQKADHSAARAWTRWDRGRSQKRGHYRISLFQSFIFRHPAWLTEMTDHG